jgi:hypothetical protein
VAETVQQELVNVTRAVTFVVSTGAARFGVLQRDAGADTQRAAEGQQRY